MTSPPWQRIYDRSLRHDDLRLLQVKLPLADDDNDSGESRPLSFLLTTFSFSDCPNYQCVSYAWHEPLAAQHPINSIILVNDVEVPIQPNLAHGLRVHVADVRQFADSDGYEAQWLWIDALCINQADIPERNAQVGAMHFIYGDAWKVLVWLGPDPDGEAYTVREFFRALRQKFWVDEDGKPNYEKQFLYRHARQPLPVTMLPPLNAEIWACTVDFWERAWFARSWVQQEVVLAKEVEVWCGDTMFDPLELEQASKFYCWSGLGGSLLPLRDSTPSPCEKIYEDRAIGTGFFNFSIVRALLAGSSSCQHDLDRKLTDRLVGPADTTHKGQSGRSMLRIFVCFLYDAISQRASDERDKVFALLVLMKQMASAYDLEEIPLVADYSKSVESVYRETTAWIIKESG